MPEMIHNITCVTNIDFLGTGAFLWFKTVLTTFWLGFGFRLKFWVLSLFLKTLTNLTLRSHIITL